MVIIINIILITQAKAWVTLMKEADDGEGTLTYEVLFMLFMLFMILLRLEKKMVLLNDFNAFNDQNITNIQNTLFAIKEFNDMVRKAQTIMSGE